MKTTSKLIAGLILTSSVVASCNKKEKDNTSPSNPAPSLETIDIRGNLTGNIKWTKDKLYRLRGYVYVESGSSLEIEAGTKIISSKDSAAVFVIYKDAKIFAKGTAQNPIVFTSAEKNPAPGDLGGIVIVGNATGNGNHKSIEGGVDAAHKAFGGTNDADNSGILSYVRIEYAGKAVNPDDEVNGLSLYTVGNGTQIDHIQVSRGLDDAYEFFGGSVNAKYLIAYNCADDDFDFDDGYHGHIQYALAVKDPRFTDSKTGGDVSNNIEADNTNGKIPYNTSPYTSATLSNFTLVGPNNALNTSTDHGYNVRFRRGAKMILANSVILGGQKAGLVVENGETQVHYRNAESGLINSFIHAVTSTFNAKNGSNLYSGAINPDSLDHSSLETISVSTYGSKKITSATDMGLIDPFNVEKPNCMPNSGATIATTASKFDVGNLKNSFFSPSNYIGAFAPGSDWTLLWTSWED